MARARTRPQPRSRTRQKSKPTPGLARLLRSELIGGGLVLLALLLLLSLLSPTRGQVTAALIDGVRLAFGWGSWVAPFLLGLIGLWLALRDVMDSEVLAPARIGGALGLFAAFEGFAHLWAGQPDPFAAGAAGQAGGALGWLLGGGLVATLGMPAALASLIILTIGSSIAFAGRTLTDVRLAVSELLRSWQGHQSDPARLSPTLPWDEPKPLWQRWREALTDRLSARRKPPLPPVNGSAWQTGKPEPTAAVRPQPITRAPQGLTTPARTAETRPAEQRAAAPPPRAIGGGQSWRLPVLAEILEDNSEQEIQQDDLRRRVQIIETTLAGFGVPVQVVEVNQGPAITQFGLRPGVIVRKDRKGEEKQIKVRVAQIQQLSNDLSLALAASPIRIEAPVPGRDFVGIEVPNSQISLVSLRGVMEAEEFGSTKGALRFGMGRDVSGQAVVTDMARMPHMLIAGATGSGKSVCVNTIITSLLLTHTPETLRLLMVDPKRVELTVYNGVPHLIAPVVVDVERAVPVLAWATREMERRYKLFAKIGARNIDTYNEKLAPRGEPPLPFIVIIIDELADLMLSAPEEVERYICRIAQMARATGMHLVLATQRPSVDVVTGLIKANFPSRIAFAVTSQVDSRVILDTPGAEQLLGRGDMLYMAPDASKLQRLQGCFVSDRETSRLVQYWKGIRSLVEPQALGEAQGDLLPDDGAVPGTERVTGWHDDAAGDASSMEPPWLPGQESLQQPLWEDMAATEATAGDRDDIYRQAVDEVRKSGKASISLLQRKLRIGYSRSARIIDQMEADGIIGPEQNGSRGREVLAEALGSDGNR